MEIYSLAILSDSIKWCLCNFDGDGISFILDQSDILLAHVVCQTLSLSQPVTMALIWYKIIHILNSCCCGGETNRKKKKKHFAWANIYASICLFGASVWWRWKLCNIYLFEYFVNSGRFLAFLKAINGAHNDRKVYLCIVPVVYIRYPKIIRKCRLCLLSSHPICIARQQFQYQIECACVFVCVFFSSVVSSFVLVVLAFSFSFLFSFSCWFGRWQKCVCTVHGLVVAANCYRKSVNSIR